MTVAEPRELVARFQKELEAIYGQSYLYETAEAAGAALQALAAENKWQKIGLNSSPLVEKVAESLPVETIKRVSSDWSPQQIALLDAAIIPAELLLADTGSALIICREQHERLMCYLPPVCVIVGAVDRIFCHLPAAWPAIAAWAADLQTRGEFVIITGPSRTADIEKILILGVHGPKKLIVLLIG